MTKFPIIKLTRAVIIFCCLRVAIADAPECPGEEDNLFVQYHPFMSGLYTLNNSSCRYVMRDTSDHWYEFYQEIGLWMFVEFRNYSGPLLKTVHKAINGTLEKLIQTKMTNYQTREPMPMRRPLHPDFKPNRFNPTGKRKGFSSGVIVSSPLGTPTENMTNELDSDLKVYYPKKCLCRTILEVGLEFWDVREYQRLDTNLSLAKECDDYLENYFNFLPEEAKSLLKPSLNDSTLTTGVISGSWKPELYVSKSCEVIFYHPTKNIWYSDIGEYCPEPQIFWSNDTVPCLEYLQSDQNWLGYRQAPNTTDNAIHLCGNTYEKASVNFKVICTSMDNHRTLV